MKRREFIKLLSSGAAAWPVAARAQQKTLPVVGVLYSGNSETLREDFAAVRDGLAETGFVQGQNIAFEFRMAEGNFDRLSVLADDLVRRRVAVIFSASNAAATLAAKAATTTIPVVFFMGADPVDIGAVASLAHPGGNITGVTVLAGELFGKRLELLHEIAPTVAKIAYLVNQTNPAYSESWLSKRAEEAHGLGLQLVILNASTPSDIDHAFALVGQERLGAVLIGTDTFFQMQRDQIVTLATRSEIPVSYPRSDYVAAGGLISYGTDFFDAYHRIGVYVGRILRGENPKNLPVQQPTKFKLVVNLKTAKQIGVGMPLQLINRADEVIE
jgi:putative tryptophan/tyrosine transport system substrate-binding protein